MEKFASTARVIDGTLILTLPDAMRPVVWQMQLGQTKSSALEVRDTADGNYMLVLKTPRMDVMEIAPFSNKDAAVRALIAVARAMEKAHGQLGNNGGPYPVPAVMPGRYASSSPAGGWLGRVMKFILYTFMTLFILIVLTIGISWLRHSGHSADNTDINAQMAPPPVQAQMPAPRAPAAGTPMSADEFLNNQ